MTQRQPRSKETNLCAAVAKTASDVLLEITLHGEARKAVPSIRDNPKLSADQGRKIQTTNFLEFLRNSPFYGLDLEIERDKSGPREIDL